MTFALVPQMYLNRCLVLLALVAISALSVSTSKAQPEASRPKTVRLTVVVTAQDVATNNLIANANILIERDSPNDVAGVTKGDGRYEREEVDFVISKAPYLLIVKAPGYAVYSKSITENDLLQAHASNDKTLNLIASMTKPNSSNTNVAATDSNQSGITQTVQPVPGGTSLAATALAVANTGLWGLGWIFIGLVAGSLVAFFIFDTRMSFHRAGEPSLRDNVGSLLSTVNNLKAEVQRVNSQQEEAGRKLNELTGTLKDVQERVTKLPTNASGGKSHTTSSSNAQVGADQSTAQQRSGEYGMSYRRSPQDDANFAYQSLVAGRSPGQEPIYLTTEEGDPMGKLKDKYIYLSEGSPQGAFVLFPLDGHNGLVFPNPGMRFRQSALRPLFPNLTEDEFERNKANIHPREAHKTSDGRWSVES